MLTGKQEFLSYVDEIEDHLHLLGDIAQDVPEFSDIADEDFEDFLKMYELLGKIARRFLPLSLFCSVIVHEGKAKRAERN